MSPSDLHSAWARLFFSSLAGAGIRDVVISPGSRSTPLALAAYHEPRLRTQLVLDERDAAFFALGQARVSGVASVLLCTSGTAGAHYLPAAIEAAHSHLPLLMITADRPWEAYAATAAQTIDQVKLFGDYVRHYAELGLPDPAPAALRAVVRIATQAVAATRAPLPGPVHVNARFRQPLEPVEGLPAEPWAPLMASLLARPTPQVYPAVSSIDPQALDRLSQRCAEVERGLIVCGPAWAGGRAAALRAGVAALAAATGFAVWAEATSGVRFGSDPAQVGGGFDALLRSADFRRRYPAQLVIELGGPPVSTAYASYLGECGAERVVVAPYGFSDPSGNASLLVFGDPAELASELAARLRSRRGAAPLSSAWQLALAAAEQLVWDCVAAESEPGTLSEGAVAQLVVEALPAESLLLIGNSLPVRDLDTFCPPLGKPLRLLHQRGASGIDGLIAGAAGGRSVTDQPLAVLLGDLSALHDLGGFNLLRSVAGPLCVVIVQNGGGRIFEQLPIARSPSARPAFEQLFLTPQTVSFSHVAALFGLGHQRAASPAALAAALHSGLQSGTPCIIEALVPPTDGTARRARIWQRVADKVAPPAAAIPPAAPLLSTAKAPLPRVYLHGFLGAPASWQSIAAATLGAGSFGYLPGHGLLPWTLPGGDFWAVIDALAASLPFERYELCGYSMGARLALALAVRHPQRVAGLTLVSVDPGLRSDSDRAARQEWEEGLATELEGGSLDSFVDRWESLPLFASQALLPSLVRAEQRRQRLAHVPTALAWALRTLGTGRMPELWSALPDLPLPIRVLSGAQDTKFAQLGAELATLSPHIEHRCIAGVGHNLLLEAPEAIRRALTDLPPTKV